MNDICIADLFEPDCIDPAGTTLPENTKREI